jgi:transcription termination factor Rho
MDNEPLDSSISIPKKRAPRKTVANKKPVVRKPRAKKVDDIVPESFSAMPDDTITCEYSDLIRSENVEDWSPVLTVDAHKACVAIGETTNLESFSDHFVAGSPAVEDSCHLPEKVCVEQPVNDSSVPSESNGDKNDRESYTHTFAPRGSSDGNFKGNNRDQHYKIQRDYSRNHFRHNASNNNFHADTSNENNRNLNRNFHQNAPQNRQNRRRPATTIRIGPFSIGYLRGLEYFDNPAKLGAFYAEVVDNGQIPFCLNEVWEKPDDNGDDFVSSINGEGMTSRAGMIDNCMESALAKKRPIIVKGILESMEGGDGIITYGCDCYKIRAKSTFVPRCLIQALDLRRGQTLTAVVHPPLEQSTCPFAIKVNDVFGKPPEQAVQFSRFKDLVPYYPTNRIFLERRGSVEGDNLAMRVIDLLSPIGFGQRGLIVAPPRTGKTMLLQGIANAIIHNQPEVKLIVLLIDERPEEVTDFSRQVRGAEIVSSTFDESADSHVHAAEIVIENARRRVEAGEHVVILLDSITRLARAYNAEQPSSGKILSGGIEANALQVPKRFFGSARNIEGGGSLTIIATALIETGSRMDDVIFEEFKGTGNMELHLDRSIADKRIFPAINFERSGTRKEELLYHPDELAKIYNLRRVFQGVPPAEAMEMLIARVKKCSTNVEFLMNINRGS